MKTHGVTMPVFMQIETKKPLQTVKKKLVHGVSRCNSHAVVHKLNVEVHLNLKFRGGRGVVFFTLNYLV